jgi:hypothetical protein
MAISKNPNLEGFRGTIDKTIVVRIDPWRRSILSSYPDMSNIVPTIAQKQQRLNFKEAQTIALKMLSDPDIKAFYQEKCEGRQRPHNILISELLKKEKPENQDEGNKGIVITPARPLKVK